MATRVNPYKADTRRKKDAEAQAAKQQAESTRKQRQEERKKAEVQTAKWQADSTLEADARRKKEAEAKAGKRQAESTCKQMQGERESLWLRQLSANLNHPKMWRTGDNKTLRTRKAMYAFTGHYY